MKIALVTSISSQPVFVKIDEPLGPPLGILSLATLLSANHDVRIFDGEISCGRPLLLSEKILDWKPDLVGFSVNFSTRMASSRKMAKHIKKKVPAIVIIFGGNYVTFNWRSIIETCQADFVVLHEGEQSFPALIEYLEGHLSQLPPGIVRRQQGNDPDMVPFRDYIKDLETLPFFDYDLFDDHSVYEKTIVTSRGCPYNCIYCSTKQMWKKWRFRSARHVVQEMLMLADRYQCEQITFNDDTCLVNEERGREICSRLTAEGGSIHWGFSTRLETLSDDMVPVLAKAGCNSLFIGCESGSDRILSEMKRRYTALDIFHKVKLCNDHGIKIRASFIVGLPWETEADVRQTFDMMKRIATNQILLNIFTPLPGTRSFEHPETFGIDFINQPNPEKNIIGFGHCDYNTRHLTARRIKELWLEGLGIV
ncbi:B12-binding domain-containing radical SAM protein, partial [bacterium]|nr:B12-binding domain-containing radical SAM protein [bacterium]